MQILAFSYQKLCTTIINVSLGAKVALPLVLCQCEIKMASKLTAKIMKKRDFLGRGSVFLQYHSLISDV